MGVLSFPTSPNGDVKSLWEATLELVQQLEGMLFTTINGVTIGTAETAVAHGKKDIPSMGIAIPRTNVAVWQSSQPDSVCCYFTAASSVVCDIKVFR